MCVYFVEGDGKKVIQICINLKYTHSPLKRRGGVLRRRRKAIGEMGMTERVQQLWRNVVQNECWVY